MAHAMEVNFAFDLNIWAYIHMEHFLIIIHRQIDTMWSIVQVTETGTLALTQQLSELRTNNMNDVPEAPKPIFEVCPNLSLTISLYPQN